MTTKRHGKWVEREVFKMVDEKPDYRSRMSDNSKKIITIPIYKDDKLLPEPESDHLSLFKNIFN